MILPLSAEAKRLGVDIDFENFIPAVMENMEYEGEYYSIPLENLNRVLMYNKSILKEANLLDENEKPLIGNSLEEFRAALDTLKEKLPDDVYPLVISMRPPQFVLNWLSLYYQLEQDKFIDLEKKEAVFDNDAAIKVFQRVIDLDPNNKMALYEIEELRK